jgi:hypothetical protein
VRSHTGDVQVGLFNLLQEHAVDITTDGEVFLVGPYHSATDYYEDFAQATIGYLLSQELYPGEEAEDINWPSVSPIRATYVVSSP